MSRVALSSSFTVSVALIAASAATATGTTYASETAADARVDDVPRAVHSAWYQPRTGRARSGRRRLRFGGHCSGRWSDGPCAHRISRIHNSEWRGRE
jgi:hypothetical protein